MRKEQAPERPPPPLRKGYACNKRDILSEGGKKKRRDRAQDFGALRGYVGHRDGASPHRGRNVAEWSPLIGSAATGFDDHRRRRYGRHRGRGRADPTGDSR